MRSIARRVSTPTRRPGQSAHRTWVRWGDAGGRWHDTAIAGPRTKELTLSSDVVVFPG